MSRGSLLTAFVRLQGCLSTNDQPVEVGKEYKTVVINGDLMTAYWATEGYIEPDYACVHKEMGLWECVIIPTQKFLDELTWRTL